RVESVVNVPLIDNELGLRVAGTFAHEGGWVDQPAAGLTNFNDQNLADVRIKALWQVAQGLKIKTMAVIHRNNGSPGYAEDANGNFTQVGGLTTTPHTQDDYDLLNLTATYDFAVAQLLSATSYLKQRKNSTNEGSASPLIGPPDTTPLYADIF